MSEPFCLLLASAALREFRAGDRVASTVLRRAGRADPVRHTRKALRRILHRAGAAQLHSEAYAWSAISPCHAVAAESCLAAILPRRPFRAGLQAATGLAEHGAKSRAPAVQAARPKAAIRPLPHLAARLDAWRDKGNRLPERRHWKQVAADHGVTRGALSCKPARRRTRNGNA